MKYKDDEVISYRLATDEEKAKNRESIWPRQNQGAEWTSVKNYSLSTTVKWVSNDLCGKFNLSVKLYPLCKTHDILTFLERNK